MRTKQCTLWLLAAFLTISGMIFAQNVKEMNPTLGRLLDFDPKMGEQWEKADKILEEIHWDFSKLTDDNLKFFKQIHYNKHEHEVAPGYYDAIGSGCSWYCGGGTESISASSYLKSNNPTITYVPQNAHDLSFKTAWVEGVDGYGIGESITYYFKQSAPRITKIIIANGYVKSPKAWMDNSRVKKMMMYLDDKPFAILNLEDCRNEQIFEFDPIGRKRPLENKNEIDKLPAWTLKFEILEVYQGDLYDDTALSQIYFDGIDVH